MAKSKKTPFKGKKSVPKQSFEITERSDVDPHQGFDPEELGMEDWGDGFYVHAEPVVIERNPDGAIARTTPLSEATPHQLFPSKFDAGSEPIEAEPVPKMSKRRMQAKTVDMMAGLLMVYYSRLKPGQIAYNPLYDGIPLEESLAGDLILEPNKTDAQLTHVSASEVHEWLKKLLGKRAELINHKTGQKGWSGDISDLSVRLKR